MAVYYSYFENICVRDISQTKEQEGICVNNSALFESGNSLQLVSSGTRNEKRVGKTRSSEMMLEGGTQGVIPPPPPPLWSHTGSRAVLLLHLLLHLHLLLIRVRILYMFGETE